MHISGPNVAHQVRYFWKHRRRLSVVTAFLLVAITASSIFAASGILRDSEPGTHDGKTKLINNWTVTPAGRQSNLGDLPLNAILSPNGRFLLVSNGGAGVQSLQVVSTSDSTIVQTIPYTVPNSVFVGLAYSPDGKHAYAAGGGSDVVHTYAVAASGKLTPTGDIAIGTVKDNPFPTGISISPDGKTLYVANNLANTVSVVDTATNTVTDTIKIGNYPYTTLVSKNGKTVYATNWGEATVSVIDARTKTVKSTIKVGNHPSAMAFGPDHLLFVTDANSDAVSVIDTDDSSNQDTRRISLAPYRNAPLSSSPDGLAVSADGRYLYVVNAGNNDVVVIALHGERGPEKVIGRIPTAWYPTSVNVSRNNKTLYVTNGKGLGAGPNNKKLYPNPTRKNPPIVVGINGVDNNYCSCTYDQYAGSMIVGTLSTIGVPTKGQLALYSEQVSRNNREQDKSIYLRSPGNPIPLPGGKSPIKHVIYIIKENRTYDQVFGDETIGNNDPSLTLFPRSNTPNEHSLVDRFGILDNFYADAEVSADGHNWISSANATDYNEKMWPQDYSSDPGRNRGYDFEGGSTINLSPGGYLWDSAAAAKISYRDYGEFANNASASSATLIPESEASSCTGPIAHSYIGKTVPAGQVLCFGPTTANPTTTPNLVGHVDPKFRSYDLNYRESDRVAEWQREFNQFVAANDFPQLELLRLPNDHTAGTRTGTLTPQAFVAENDNAVGKVVDVVSHSKYWKDTAIFVTEDDAQNGPDHVDAHRTTSLAISSYTSRSKTRVDHTLYDTAAMVRTMELILGLKALSQYDAAAMPVWRVFNSKPDLAPYNTLPEKYTMTDADYNSPTAYGTQESARMDFSQEDRIPMEELNQVLWYSIKGTSQPYPVTANTENTKAHSDDESE